MTIFCALMTILMCWLHYYFPNSTFNYWAVMFAIMTVLVMIIDWLMPED